jgi:hypothetical protein
MALIGFTQLQGFVHYAMLLGLGVTSLLVGQLVRSLEFS